MEKNKTTEKNMLKNIMKDKRIVMVIMLIPILLLVLVLVNNISYSANKGENTNNINAEQTVEGIKVSEGLIIQDKGIYNYTAKVTNTKETKEKIEFLELIFYDKDNNKITTLYGYIGREIETNESTIVSASVDKDITKANRVVISVNK